MPKGCQLEVRAQQAPRLLVILIIIKADGPTHNLYKVKICDQLKFKQNIKSQTETFVFHNITGRGGNFGSSGKGTTISYFGGDLLFGVAGGVGGEEDS